MRALTRNVVLGEADILAKSRNEVLAREGIDTSHKRESYTIIRFVEMRY